MDRYRPRLVHQDYWPLRAIRQEIHKFLDSQGNDLHGKRVLDFGSSDAPYRPAFTAAGAEFVPADIEPKSSEILPIDVATGRVADADASFDIVLSTQVLEHVPEVQQYLREAWRLLKPGGRMLLTTHGTWYLHRVPTDMRRWTIDGLRYEHEKAGFVVDRVEPRIGMMATATHMRLVAMHRLLTKSKITAPLRVVTNLLFNLRMGLEEMLTGRSGRENLQQLIIVTSHKPA